MTTKKNKHGRLTLFGLCESKTQRFIEEVHRHNKTTNLTAQWMYNRIRKLLIPGNYVKCETCGLIVTFEGITIDHKVPRSNHKSYNGNVHNTDNLELICSTCNSMKGQKTLSEFLIYLKDRNAQIIKLTQSGIHEIVAPLFPHIGLGQELFGSDKSETRLKPVARKKHKSPNNP